MSDTELNSIAEVVDNLPSDFIIREIMPMRDVQDAYINWVMARLDGDKVETAKQLGISQKTIYNRINSKNPIKKSKELDV
jgi:DNA-binding NtrC family response regulator